MTSRPLTSYSHQVRSEASTSLKAGPLRIHRGPEYVPFLRSCSKEERWRDLEEMGKGDTVPTILTHWPCR